MAAARWEFEEEEAEGEGELSAMEAGEFILGMEGEFKAAKVGVEGWEEAPGLYWDPGAGPAQPGGPPVWGAT